MPVIVNNVAPPDGIVPIVNHPKRTAIFSFRLTRQYRAFALVRYVVLIVIEAFSHSDNPVTPSARGSSLTFVPGVMVAPEAISEVTTYRVFPTYR